ncbi:MAG: A24 family peptidase [Thermacetogeniaceae bacterium]
MNDYILLTLLLLSLYFDLTKKKIPNFLTLPVILWGLIYYTITAGFEGLIFSLLGLLLGIAVFFIPFMLGGMGGGDVKLLGAIGAMKGLQFVFDAAIYTVFCGGILAIIYLLYNGQLLRTLKRILSIIAVPLLAVLYFKFKYPFLNQLSLYFSSFADGHVSKKVYLPYGVAIAIGTILVLSGISKSFLIL